MKMFLTSTHNFHWNYKSNVYKFVNVGIVLRHFVFPGGGGHAVFITELL